MTHSTVIFLGNAGPGIDGLEATVCEFGWTLETAADLDKLRALSEERTVIAIIFDSRSLDLRAEDALRRIRSLDSEALLIPCLRFSDSANWPDLAEAGAFHAISLPFSPGEVRQSLAFVWSARLRRTANVVPIGRSKKAESAKAAISAQSVA